MKPTYIQKVEFNTKKSKSKLKAKLMELPKLAETTILRIDRNRNQNKALKPWYAQHHHYHNIIKG